MAFYNTNILIWIFIYDFEYINEYSVSKLTFLLIADKTINNQWETLSVTQSFGRLAIKYTT